MNHLEQVRKERQELAAKLKEKYLPGTKYRDDVAAIIFDRAWEEGHAHGEHEVEAYYSELVDMFDKLKTVLKDFVIQELNLCDNSGDTQDVLTVPYKEMRGRLEKM